MSPVKLARDKFTNALTANGLINRVWRDGKIDQGSLLDMLESIIGPTADLRTNGEWIEAWTRGAANVPEFAARLREGEASAASADDREPVAA